MPNAHDNTRGDPAPLLRRGVHEPVRYDRASSAIARDAICEAVFRYQLRQHAPAQLASPICYYLALRGRDPADDLMCRLWDLAPWVKKRSQCRISARDGVIDRDTGARGLIVEVSSLSWMDAAAVDVVGGYYAAPLEAAIVLYHVAYDEDRWDVKAARDLWKA